MARIDSAGSNAAALAAKQAAAERAAAARKAAAEAAKKKAAAEAAKKKAAEAAKRKDGFDPKKHLAKLDKHYVGGKSGDLSKLANGKGTSKLNHDGSTSTSHETSKKNTTTKQELTTSRNKLTGEAKLKFESTASTKTSATGSRETKHKFESQTDLLRRTTSTQSKDVTIKKGDTTTVDSRSTATDAWGNKKVTVGQSKATEHNGVTTTDAHATTKGAFNTKQTVDTHTVATFKGTGSAEEMKKGDTNTTVTNKSTKGSEFALSHSKEFADGKFTLKDSADWKKQSFNKETGKEKEWKLRDVPKGDSGFTQQKTTGVQGKLDKATKVGDALGAMGVQKTLVETPKFDNAKLGDLENEKYSFAGKKVGTSGETKVTVGADGVNAVYKREASAGLYAQHNDSVTGAHGTASYQAGAKLEAKAGVDAKGKLNLNGLDASANARVGVTAEASIKGKLESNSLGTIGGKEIKVGLEGSAKVAAEAEAHVDGKVKITRNPPSAIVEGSAGASAVVKAEAEVKASAGPFSVKASGYASAGAEAKASGVLGYSDGKLKIGGSLGAAVGLGLGGSVNVEVDVKQIGEMAKNTADINHDGKLDIHDATAAARKVVGDKAVDTAKAAVHTVANVASSAVSTVSSAAKTVSSWFGW